MTLEELRLERRGRFFHGNGKNWFRSNGYGVAVDDEMVRRWNSYPALLEALDGLVETVDRYWVQVASSRREMPENTASALEAARAAIKQAKGDA